MDGLQILICEDQPLTASWLEKAVTRAGHTLVGRAADGEEAIRLAREGHPDLIFMDVMMPLLDGIAATEKIMADNPTAIVIVTGRADAATIAAAMEAGASNYLVKPLTEHQLAPTMAAALARFREQQELSRTRERLAQEVRDRETAEAAALLAREESLTDPLTGAANRRGLTERLEHELARAERSGSPLAIALLDVDNFKQVNDDLGHPSGDRLLRDLVIHARRELRRTDLVARYGGDEFVLVLPDTGAEAALSLVTRLATALQALGDPLNHRVTISFGVACCFASGGITAEALLACADEAMYASKQRGAGLVTVVELEGQRNPTDADGSADPTF